MVGAHLAAWSVGGVLARVLIVFGGCTTLLIVVQQGSGSRPTQPAAVIGCGLIGPMAATVDSPSGSVLALGIAGVLVFLAAECLGVGERIGVLDTADPVGYQGRVRDAGMITGIALVAVLLVAIADGTRAPGGVALVVVVGAVVAALAARVR
jgi:hypothetical protein